MTDSPGSRSDALERLRRFVKMMDTKPLKRDDVIYSIHTGTEWAAEIRLSDIRAAVSERGKLVPVAWAVVDKKSRLIQKTYMTYGDASWGVAEMRGKSEMVPLYGEQSTIPAERPG